MTTEETLNEIQRAAEFARAEIRALTGREATAAEVAACVKYLTGAEVQ